MSKSAYTDVADYNMANPFLMHISKLLTIGSEANLNHNLNLWLDTYTEIFTLLSPLFRDEVQKTLITNLLNELSELVYKVNSEIQERQNYAKAMPLKFKCQMAIVEQIHKNNLLMKMIQMRGIEKLEKSVGLR